MRKSWQNIHPFLLLFVVFLLVSADLQAQFSPSKKYSSSYLTGDTTRTQLLKDYQPVVPKGSPNIIIIMLDDVGFGTS